MATVKAQLNNFRLAPRKMRAVVGLIKGKGALKAIDQLEFMIRRPSMPLIKLIRSAIANAENNFNMVPGNLFIKELYVDEGVKLKRFRPKGFGRAGEIQKKTSHVRLVLSEKVAGLKAEKKAKEPVKHEHVHKHEAEPKIKSDKPEIKTEIGKKDTQSKNTLRKIFQRKQV